MRVQRAFAFVDICGFTSFVDRHADDEVVLVLARLRTTLREIAARRGVRVVKWLGDGAMLSSPDVDELVGLVLEVDVRMTEALPHLPIRAGMSVGPVIMFEGDDYIGRSVNIASRLCAEAQPREVLATAEVFDRAPNWVISLARRDVILRGLEEPQAVSSLGIRREQETMTDPVCGLTIPSRSVPAWIDHLGFCSAACLDAWRGATESDRAVEQASLE